MEIPAQPLPLIFFLDNRFSILSRSEKTGGLPDFTADPGENLTDALSAYFSKHSPATAEAAKRILAESLDRGIPGNLEWADQAGRVIRMRAFPSTDKKNAHVMFEDISAELMRKNMLAVRQVFEELIKELSQILADIRFLDNRWLRHFLKKLAGFLGADRSFLFLDAVKPGKERRVFTYPVPVEHEESQIPDLDPRTIRGMADMVMAIPAQGPPFICMKAGSGDSAMASELDKFLRDNLSFKAGPTIILPFYSHRVVLGFFLFTCHEAGSFAWPEQFLDVLAHISNMVGTRIDREAALSALQETEEEKQKLQDKFLISQKMDAIGRLAAGIAHDFNNILGGILGHAELLLEEAHSHPVVPYYAEGIIKATERASALTQQLLVFSKKQSAAPRNMDPNKALAEAAKMIQRVLGEDIALSFDPASRITPILFDPSQFDHLILNLVVNSREAMPAGGTLSISTSMVKPEDFPEDLAQKAVAPGYVCINIMDTGSGMNQETKKALFEPFFTTRQSEGHRGLGLSTVYAIITQNSGFIHVDTMEHKGTTVRLFIPAAIHSPEGVVKPMYTMKPGLKSILVVEDEPGLRAILRKLLEKSGFTVIESGDPTVVLTDILPQKPVLDLLVSDVIMPGMNGKQLYQALESEYPGLKALFMSGYPADVLGAHGIIPEEINFLQKPFTNQRLLEKIKEVLLEGNVQEEG